LYFLLMVSSPLPRRPDGCPPVLGSSCSFFIFLELTPCMYAFYSFSLSCFSSQSLPEYSMLLFLSFSNLCLLWTGFPYIQSLFRLLLSLFMPKEEENLSSSEPPSAPSFPLYLSCFTQSFLPYEARIHPPIRSFFISPSRFFFSPFFTVDYFSYTPPLPRALFPHLSFILFSPRACHPFFERLITVKPSSPPALSPPEDYLSCD